MTKIAIYLFGYEEAQTIATRTIKRQHWYAAIDICNLLGITNHSQAVHRERETDELTLADGEWLKKSIFNGGSKRKMLLVNDNGMLKLILQAAPDKMGKIQERARKAPVDLIPESWQTELLN